MKIVLVLCALVGMSLAAPTPYTLKEDLEAILQEIPIEEIVAILKTYIDTDTEVQQVLTYLQGDDWAELVAYVGAHETWIGFKDYLKENDIDVDAIIAYIHDLIAGATPGGKGTRSLRDCVDEILAIVNFDRILLVVADKLENSKDFQELYKRVASDKSRSFVEEIRALPEVQRIANVLRDMEIDVDSVIEFVYIFLGWV